MGLLVFIAYSIRTIRTILYHLFWWDMKEYRFDRMKVHLSQTAQGRTWMFGPIALIKWVLLFLYVFEIANYLDWIVYAVYIFEAGNYIFNFSSDKRPSEIRPKIMLIFIGSVLFELLLVPLVSFDYPLGLALLIGDKLLAFVILFQVWALSILYWFYKKSKIRKAHEKFARAKHLKVIGITGSFGKTTVKEFTHQILSQKFKTLKTEKSQNSDIGIAELILRTDLSDYEYFVCEMAAYHKGEIKSSTSILKDKIHSAVVTGINEQHQSLFGSLDTTKKAKYELIQDTRKGGDVIVNSINEGSREMGEWAKDYGYNVCFIDKTDIIKNYPSKVAPHVLLNATLAAKASESTGMSKRSITYALKKLSLPEKTLDETKVGNVLVINDTFNANPEAAYAVLNYIKRRKGTKVLVLQPLIELGKYANEIHEKIGKMSAQICDYVVLTNENWNHAFMKGAKSVPNTSCKIQVGGSLPKLKSGIMIFEGKEAEQYLIQK